MEGASWMALKIAERTLASDTLSLFRLQRFATRSAARGESAPRERICDRKPRKPTGENNDE